MIKRHLASLSALAPIEVALGAIKERLDAANEASNQLRAPTVDERASLYLRAVNEKSDFTTEEHSRARELILDAMAAEIIAKSKVSLPEELTLSKQVSDADLQELASRKIVSLAAATTPSADAMSSPSQIAPFRLTSRKLATRKRFIFAAAIAAVAACFLFIVIPTYWFTANPTSIESQVAMQSLPQKIEMESVFPGTPKQVEITAAPRAQMNRITGDDTLTEETVDLLKRGRELIATHDIPAARLVLKQAAEAGDASAALELGGTYDPVVLEELMAQSEPVASSIAEKSVLPDGLMVTSDIAMARAWYQRAKELGSAEASKRLERLPGPNR
jgi:hypothetical protein